MKFNFSFEKKNAANYGQMVGHNERHHPTKSQLPKYAWLTPQGCHVIKKFDHELLEKAKAMSKRKDAIFAVELTFGVGDQTAWRDMPTEEIPEGPPMAGNSKRINQLIKATRAAVEAELGSDRIISMTLHTDESKPHVHVVFAPILDGKLNAKNWTGGVKACEKFRESMHSHFNKIFPCTYTKGGHGGEPHDPEKAAGKSRAPRPAPQPKSGFVKSALDALSARDEVKLLSERLDAARTEIQRIFSELKRVQQKAAKDFDEQGKKLLEAIKRREDAERKGREAAERIKALESRLEAFQEAQKPRVGVELVNGLKNAPRAR